MAQIINPNVAHQIYDHKVRNPEASATETNTEKKWIQLEKVYTSGTQGDKPSFMAMPLMAGGSYDTPVYIDSAGVVQEVSDVNAEIKNKILANVADVSIDPNSPYLSMTTTSTTDADGVIQTKKVISDSVSSVVKKVDDDNISILDQTGNTELSVKKISSTSGYGILVGSAPSGTSWGNPSINVGISVSPISCAGSGTLVLGKYNSPVQNDILEIGNGTSNAARSNVFRIASDGYVWTKNSITASNIGYYASDNATTYSSLRTLHNDVQVLKSAQVPEEIYVGAATSTPPSGAKIWIQT